VCVDVAYDVIINWAPYKSDLIEKQMFIRWE